MGSSSGIVTTTTESFNVSRKTLTASVPIESVIRALEVELKSERNAPGVFPAIVRRVLSMEVPVPKGVDDGPMTKQKIQAKEFESVVGEHLGEMGFMLFNRINHHVWYDLYRPRDTKRKMVVRFIYGNPLVANTMMKHSYVSGLHVPTNLLLIGDEESTSVVYDVPSSLIVVEHASVPFSLQTESEGLEGLEKAARGLDEKVEILIKGAFARAAEASRRAKL